MSHDPNLDDGALTERVYQEMRRLAERYMERERPGHTLQPTALVHEAFLRVAGSGATVRDRSHFLALSARAMRRILVDHARRRRASKRGGDAQRVTLDLDRHEAGDGGDGGDGYDLIALNDAIEALFSKHPRKARVVELRYFGGFEIEEIAEHLQVSKRTVLYDCRSACAWLHAELTATD